MLVTLVVVSSMTEEPQATLARDTWIMCLSSDLVLEKVEADCHKKKSSPLPYRFAGPEAAGCSRYDNDGDEDGDDEMLASH